MQTDAFRYEKREPRFTNPAAMMSWIVEAVDVLRDLSDQGLMDTSTRERVTDLLHQVGARPVAEVSDVADVHVPDVPSLDEGSE